MYSAATEELIREHRDVECLLDRLEVLLDDVNANRREITDTFALVRRDLGVHLRKEEEAYFPALENYIPKSTGPLAVMLIDHNDLRRLEEEFPENGLEFIAILRQHIQKEDHVLFPLAEARFTPEERESVYGVMQEIGKGATAAL